MYEIYTDGSCSKNKTGGYGYIVVKNNEIIDRFARRVNNTTNQRMELTAIIAAYKYFEKNNITQGKILSDSSYCLNCFFEKWYIRWEKNGYKSAKNNDVKNQDLWRLLIPYYKNSKIELEKVKGHSDCLYNNIIDSLVTTISNTLVDDLTNKRIGFLTVETLWGNKFTEGQGKTFWKCKCDCGNIKIFDRSNLLHSHSQSCGCQAQKEKYKDITGEKFGYLEPLEKIGKDEFNYAIWKCKCNNCGSIIEISSNRLKNQISCGCIKSKGEEKIAKILTENNYNFIREWKTKELVDIDLLKFDFAILDDNGKLLCLIEYQGRQHYEIGSGWSNENHLQRTQKHDQMKREYCKQNNIKLVEIPYTDFDKIDNNYIQEVVLGD